MVVTPQPCKWGRWRLLVHSGLTLLLLNQLNLTYVPSRFLRYTSLRTNDSTDIIKLAKKKKGGGSLQDQLKAAGLVSSKDLKKAQKQMHRKEVRVKQGVETDEVKLAAERALKDKQQADRAANEARNVANREKELNAQIKQLIERNSQRQKGDVAYNFSEQNKIKKIYVSEENKRQINKGFLAIVKQGDDYDLVPKQVAERISNRIPDRKDEVVLYIYDSSKDQVDEDDPYKDFQIPDDLEW